MPQPVLRCTAVPSARQNKPKARGTHAPAHAESHARARIGVRDFARAAEARPCYTSSKPPERCTPQPVPSRTAVRAINQTSRRVHGLARARTHAHAESRRLPEPGTPQAVPCSTFVPSKKL
ncbi:hypothetical protein JCGZ_13534 [Jatropha curcas]|uniref:Uncharacterized protein n=1 Tax=Jatropha curcas TaxID=180498 RepID=A0A067KAG4_JATCU|nr:hypothetical protein JCGZ_13534 [Jatropha curcas]